MKTAKRIPCATGAWDNFARMTNAIAPMPTPVRASIVARPCASDEGTFPTMASLQKCSHPPNNVCP